MELIHGIKPQNWIAMLYGVPGVGKSTLASLAPQPIFVDVENGIQRLDCVRTPHLRTLDEVHEGIKSVANHPECKTIVIDSLSSVEELLQEKILTKYNEENGKAFEAISQIPYGVGTELLKAQWALFIKGLFKVKNVTGKNILCIAHESIEPVPNPLGESYERYSPAIHKKSIGPVIGKMDAVFFAQFEKVLKKKPGTDDKKVAIETGRRVIQTVEKPHCAAKNRFSLPELIDFTSREQAVNFWELIK